MAMKRIAVTSNYDSEMFNEEWLNVPPMTEEQALEICQLLNEVFPQGPKYYQPKPMDYQLYKFEP